MVLPRPLRGQEMTDKETFEVAVGYPGEETALWVA
jgi:hypothetical protein